MLNIRYAIASDVPLIVQFIRELAEYERAPEQAVAAEADLLRGGFSSGPGFRVLIAGGEWRPAGYAVFLSPQSPRGGPARVFSEGLCLARRISRGRTGA